MKISIKATNRKLAGKAFGVLAGLFLLIVCMAVLAADLPTAPKFKVDPDWPKPLPNKWKMGGVTGLAVDKDDNVWVHDRPNDLTDIELEAELNPPIADCCVRPPSMIHIDKEGNVIGSIDPPQGHGMTVDSKGFIYLGNTDKGLNTVRKYDPKTGALVAEVPRVPEPQPGGGGDAAVPNPRPPGHGSMGPVAGFLPGGRPKPDPAAVAARKAAMEAFVAKYPPTTPMIVGQIEEVRLDEPAHELYAADSYLGGRVMVFDMDTFKFKRGWGAYGHMLDQITTNEADRAYTPGGPMPKEFRGHLTLNVSHDGFVYAADRMANRIQVFTKEGKYQREFIIAPMTGVGGATGGVMFSPDKAQRLLYISDLTNNHIYFVNREDGKIISQMGSMGENAGQFYGLHMIAVDSKGDIYTGEVFGGERVQRFLPVK
jgi:DNA-binding beta-propeller fold protein YncE